MKILLINENGTVEKLVKLSATKVGLAVESVPDVASAAPGEYRWILVDHDALGDGDASAIRALSGEARVALLHPKNGDKSAGFDLYVEKPFLPTELIDAFSSHMGGGVEGEVGDLDEGGAFDDASDFDLSAGSSVDDLSLDIEDMGDELPDLDGDLSLGDGGTDLGDEMELDDGMGLDDGMALDEESSLDESTLSDSLAGFEDVQEDPLQESAAEPAAQPADELDDLSLDLDGWSEDEPASKEDALALEPEAKLDQEDLEDSPKEPSADMTDLDEGSLDGMDLDETDLGDSSEDAFDLEGLEDEISTPEPMDQKDALTSAKDELEDFDAMESDLGEDEQMMASEEPSESRSILDEEEVAKVKELLSDDEEALEDEGLSDLADFDADELESAEVGAESVKIDLGENSALLDEDDLADLHKEESDLDDMLEDSFGEMEPLEEDEFAQDSDAMDGEYDFDEAPEDTHSPDEDLSTLDEASVAQALGEETPAASAQPSAAPQEQEAPAAEPQMSVAASAGGDLQGVLGTLSTNTLRELLNGMQLTINITFPDKKG